MKLKRSDDFVMREIAGETFLIPVGDATKRFNGMITLNPLSTFIWQELEKAMTIDELTQAVTDTYEVETEQAKSDIKEFVDQMKVIEMVNIIE